MNGFDHTIEVNRLDPSFFQRHPAIVQQCCAYSPPACFRAHDQFADKATCTIGSGYADPNWMTIFLCQQTTSRIIEKKTLKGRLVFTHPTFCSSAFSCER